MGSSATEVVKPLCLSRAPGERRKPYPVPVAPFTRQGGGYPPDTGGRNATSSPSATGVCLRAYVALTATDIVRS